MDTGSFLEKRSRMKSQIKVRDEKVNTFLPNQKVKKVNKEITVRDEK